MSNAGPYSGVTTSTLTVTGVTATMNNYQYRCLVNNGTCADTSHVASLLTGVDDIDNSSEISIYPNPSNGSFNIEFSRGIQQGAYEVYNSIGQVVIKGALGSYLNCIRAESLLPGCYTVKVLADGGVAYKQFLKL